MALQEQVNEIHEMQKRSQMQQLHHGVSTNQDWVRMLKNENQLVHDANLDKYLYDYKINGWYCPKPDGVSFPGDDVLESGEGGTQSFVDSILSSFYHNNEFEVHRESKKKAGVFNKKPSCKLQLSCFPVENSYARPSFGTRKPDNVFRSEKNVGGAHSIVMIGENKRRAQGAFSDDEIGHILDMAKQLMVHHQKKRQFMYCFLSDGFRFQFFSIHRFQAGFEYCHSRVYEGVLGWQVILF